MDKKQLKQADCKETMSNNMRKLLELLAEGETNTQVFGKQTSRRCNSIENETIQ